MNKRTIGWKYRMFDEMMGSGSVGEGVRPAYAALSDWLSEVKPDVLDFRRSEAELLFRRIGITFAVSGDSEAQERLIPFDIIPRILSAPEWELYSAGSSNASGRLTLISTTSIIAARFSKPA